MATSACTIFYQYSFCDLDAAVFIGEVLWPLRWYPFSICSLFCAEDRERECDKSMVNDSKKLERMIGKNELPLSAVNIKKNGSAEQTGYAYTFVALLWWARQCHSNFL